MGESKRAAVVEVGTATVLVALALVGGCAAIVLLQSNATDSIISSRVDEVLHASSVREVLRRQFNTLRTIPLTLEAGLIHGLFNLSKPLSQADLSRSRTFLRSFAEAAAGEVKDINANFYCGSEEDGLFVSASFQRPGGLLAFVSAADGKRWNGPLDEDTQLGDFFASPTDSSYDPRQRPWYASMNETFKAALAATPEGDPLPRDLTTYSSIYPDDSTGNAVLTVAAAVTAPPLTRGLLGACAVDVAVERLRRSIRDTFANQAVADHVTVAVADASGSLWFGVGAAFDDVSGEEQLEINILTGENAPPPVQAQLAVLNSATGWSAFPSPGAAAWTENSVLTLIADDKGLSVTPLNITVVEGQDLYVVVVSPLEPLRPGYLRALLVTILGSGALILLYCASSIVTLVPTTEKRLDAFLVTRVGPRYMRWRGSVEPAIIVAVLLTSFAAWSSYLNGVIEQVAADVTTALSAYATTQVSLVAQLPFLPLLLLRHGLEQGHYPPEVGGATAQQAVALDSYMSIACGPFRHAAMCAVATAEEVSGVNRAVTAGEFSKTGHPWDEFHSFTLVSASEARRYNLSSTFPFGRSSLVQRSEMYNISTADWFLTGESAATEAWLQPAVAASGAVTTTLVVASAPSSLHLGRRVMVSVDLLMDGVSSVLEDVVATDPLSALFVLDSRSAMVLGVSSGPRLYTDPDGVKTPAVGNNFTNNGVVHLLSSAVLSRLDGNLSLLAAAPLVAEVGTPDAENADTGLFSLRATAVGKAAPWTVIVASRKDVLLASVEDDSNSSLVYSLGVVAGIILLIDMLRAYVAKIGAAVLKFKARRRARRESRARGQAHAREGKTTASTEGEVASRQEDTRERQDTERPPKVLLSNEQTQAAHAARLARMKTATFRALWPLVGGVLERAREETKAASSEDGRDATVASAPTYAALIAAAVGTVEEQFAFGVTQFDALEARIGDISPAPSFAVWLLSRPPYKVAVLSLSSLHCILALLDSGDVGVLSLDLTVTVLRLGHVILMWLHRGHVLSRDRPYKTPLLTIRTLLAATLLLDSLVYATLGQDGYGMATPATSLLRPLILLTETDALINSLASFFSTVVSSADVFIFFFIFLFIASVGGMAVFGQLDEFGTFLQALFSMFTFMATTDNYADLVHAATSSAELRQNIIFYVIFSVVGFFVFISLVIAVFQETFVVMNNVLDDETELASTGRAASFMLLYRATWAEEAGQQRGGTQEAENDEGATKSPQASEIGALAAALRNLDAEGNAYQNLRISRSVFRRFLKGRYNGLRAIVFEVTYPRSLDFDQFCSLLDQIELFPVDAITAVSMELERDLGVYTDNRTSDFRYYLARFTQSSSWQFGVLALLILLTWTLAAGAVYAGDQLVAINVVATLCFYALVVEVAVRVYAIGWTLFWNVPNDAFAMYTNRLDVLMAVVSLLAITAAQADEGTFLPGEDSTSLRTVLAFPVLRIFAYVPAMRVLFFSIIHILRIYVNMFVVLFLFTLFFSLVGTLLYRDSFGPEAELDFDASVLNFNTPAAASAALYQVMLQAEWGAIANTYASFRGQGALIYFTLFVFVQGILLANLFSGVLCEGFIYLDDLKSVLFANRNRVPLFVVDTMLHGRRLPRLLIEIDPCTDTLFVFGRQDKLVNRGLLDDSDGVAGIDHDVDDKSLTSFVKVVRDLDREVVAALNTMTTKEGCSTAVFAVAPPKRLGQEIVHADEASDDYFAALEEWAASRLDAIARTAGAAISALKSAP